jgi:transcriptional regulator with XRE-family HTH domain
MQKMLLREILARNLKNQMEVRGLTQKELEAKSGVAQSHISRILRRDAGATIDRVAEIAGALGCQPWELLANTEATRRAALERMITGPAVSDERVEDALPLPPGGARIPKTSAARRRKPPSDRT